MRRTPERWTKPGLATLQRTPFPFPQGKQTQHATQKRHGHLGDPKKRRGTCIHQGLKQRPIRVPREHAHPLPPDEMHQSKGVVHVLGHQHVRVPNLLPIPPGPSRPRSRPRRRSPRLWLVPRLVFGVAEPPVTAVALSPCPGGMTAALPRAPCGAGRVISAVVVLVRGSAIEASAVEAAAGKGSSVVGLAAKREPWCRKEWGTNGEGGGRRWSYTAVRSSVRGWP